MVIAGWSVKGGSGTTVMCAALAAVWSRSVPTVLVDLCGDAPALFGRSTAPKRGLLDWSHAHSSVGPRSLADLIDASTVRGTPDLLCLGEAQQSAASGGRAPATKDQLSRLEEGVLWLAQAYDRVVIDAGSAVDAHANAVVDLSTVGLLMMRPCTITIRAALQSRRAVMGAVLNGSGGGTLRAHDVEALLGVPVFGHVPSVRAIPAAVDAGTFGNRIPRQLHAPVRAIHHALGLEP